jgi:hypothetical protein
MGMMQLMAPSTFTVTQKLLMTTKNKTLAAINKFKIEPKNVIFSGFKGIVSRDGD